MYIMGKEREDREEEEGESGMLHPFEESHRNHNHLYLLVENTACLRICLCAVGAHETNYTTVTHSPRMLQIVQKKKKPPPPPPPVPPPPIALLSA